MAFLYLSLAADKKIACYRIDPGSGALEYLHDTPVPGEPSVQNNHPGRAVLYVAMRSTGQLLSFRVDPDSGRLSLLHTIDTGLEDPAYLRTDREGNFLLTPYYISAKVTIYPIAPDGAAREPASAVVETDLHAHGMEISPDNRFVFVPHTCPGNAVWQFELRRGQLVPNRMPKVTFAEDLGPRHLHFHPEGHVLYADNEQGNSVTTFRFDAERGTLRPEQTLSTLPPGYGEGAACARLELHPSGRFLYAANRGHDSLAGFAVHPTTGLLRPIGHFRTEKTPRSFHLEPTGRFLYAAGQDADRLTAYRIDPESGALDKLFTCETGRVPWWVQTIEAKAQ